MYLILQYLGLSNMARSCKIFPIGWISHSTASLRGYNGTGQENGENHFVIILGGLHIEMAGLKMIGNWLDDCGWVEALV